MEELTQGEMVGLGVSLVLARFLVDEGVISAKNLAQRFRAQPLSDNPTLNFAYEDIAKEFENYRPGNGQKTKAPALTVIEGGGDTDHDREK